jgi:hypothetical protein
MLHSWILRFLLFGSLLFPAAVRAQVTANTSQSAYLAAAGPQSSFSFTGGNVDYSTAAGLTIDGVNFVGTLQGIPGYYYLGTNLYGGITNLVGGFSSFSPNTSDPFEYVGNTIITFPSAVSSVSFLGVLDYGAVGSGPFTVTFSNGDVYNGDLPWTNPSPPQFIGFTSSQPFTPPANFQDPFFDTNQTEYFTPLLQSVSYGLTPEPYAIMPLAAGLALILYRRGRPCRR